MNYHFTYILTKLKHFVKCLLLSFSDFLWCYDICPFSNFTIALNCFGELRNVLMAPIFLSLSSQNLILLHWETCSGIQFPGRDAYIANILERKHRYVTSRQTLSFNLGLCSMVYFELFRVLSGPKHLMFWYLSVERLNNVPIRAQIENVCYDHDWNG